MIIHVIHGIETEAGSTTVPALFPYLEQFGEIKYPDYGWIGLLESKRLNPVIVGSLRSYVADGDIIVGHSNGCAIAYRLLQTGVLVRALVLINGALIRNIQIPTGVTFVHCYWNSGDTITIEAMLGADLSLVDPNWGDMGHAGYLGADPRVLNVDCGNTLGMPKVSGHSALFDPFNLEAWGPQIADNIRRGLNGGSTNATDNAGSA